MSSSLHNRTMFRYILIPLLFVGTLGDDDTWKLEVEYFESVSLSCSEGRSSRVLEFVHFWILPSGEVRRPFDKTANDKHLVLKNNGFLLEIDPLDDADFGMYFCVVAVGRNETDVVKFGINLDGPFYGNDYLENIKSKAIVGGVAAGSVFVVLAAVWILCANCKSKKKESDKEAMGEVNKAFEKEDEVKLSIHDGDEAGTTKVQDSVYYMADGINMEPVVSISESSPAKGTSPLLDANRVDRLSTTDSGHYYSIGSLGRDMHPPTEADIDKLNRTESSGEPGDIYKNYVKSVHESHLDEVSEAVLATTDEVFDTETESNGGSIRYASGIEYPISDDGEASATTNGTEHTHVPDNVMDLYATPVKSPKKSSAYESLNCEDDVADVKNDNTLPSGVTTTVVQVEIVNGNNGDDEDSDVDDSGRVEKSDSPDVNEEKHTESNESANDTGMSEQEPVPTEKVNNVANVTATDAETTETTEDKSSLSDGSATPPEGNNKPSSRGESTASSSEVDDETIANFNSVLASLASKKLKKTREGRGSKEDGQSSDAEDGAKSVEDIKL